MRVVSVYPVSSPHVGDACRLRMQVTPVTSVCRCGEAAVFVPTARGLPFSPSFLKSEHCWQRCARTDVLPLDAFAPHAPRPCAVSTAGRSRSPGRMSHTGLGRKAPVSHVSGGTLRPFSGLQFPGRENGIPLACSVGLPWGLITGCVLASLHSAGHPEGTPLWRHFRNYGGHAGRARFSFPDDFAASFEEELLFLVPTVLAIQGQLRGAAVTDAPQRGCARRAVGPSRLPFPACVPALGQASCYDLAC